MQLEAARYADAVALVAESVAAILPAERIGVAEYAAAHRWLANEGGGYVGRWRHEIAPYLVGPMDALTSDQHTTTAIVGPGQSGKTAVGENWLLKNVATDPADMLWYMQTDQGVEAYVKGRVNPMVEMHEEMRARLGLRPVDDSLHFKRFRGMNVEFLSATDSSLINKRAPRIIADEVDAYAPSLGDVKVMLDVRRQTYGSASMLLAMSHPDRAEGLNPERGDWAHGIMAIFADSDRRVWYWPCPHCGAWSSPAPLAARVMALDYPAEGTLDEIEALARLVCPVNGCLIEDHARRGMNQLGKWVGAGEEIAEDGTIRGELIHRRTAGFWIVGLMSPFIMGGIGALARARVKAERDFEASPSDESEATLRQVIVKQWGIPYRRPKHVGSIDANDLADRAEVGLKLGVVPPFVRFLTLAVDVQIAHWDYLVRGWGEKGESAVIETGRVPGSPATSPADWDQLLALFARAWPLADESGRAMTLRAIGIDSAGAPGVTDQAYAAWLRWRAQKALRLYGKIGGRDAWSIVLLKGASGLNAPRLQVTYPDTARKASKVSRGNVPVASFNPNLFKDALAGQLARAEPGPGFIHIPAALRSAEKPHVFFEQLTAETRLKTGRWEKAHAAARNEALDEMVMNGVVAHLHGLARIDWTRPPSWAAAWDENSAIQAPARAALPAAHDETAGATTPAPAVAPPANAVRKKSVLSKLAGGA